MSQANEHTKHANCGLRVNFWNFLFMPFCFMMKKDHFKRKLLLWPQVLLECKDFTTFSWVYPGIQSCPDLPRHTMSAFGWSRGMARLKIVENEK